MASSTIFWVFVNSRPGTEPRSPKPLANTLTLMPIEKGAFGSPVTTVTNFILKRLGHRTHCKRIYNQNSLKIVLISICFAKDFTRKYGEKLVCIIMFVLQIWCEYQYQIAQSVFIFNHSWRENNIVHIFPEDISDTCNANSFVQLLKSCSRYNDLWRLS